MKFTELLKKERLDEKADASIEKSTVHANTAEAKTITEAESPEELLRANDLKIKLVVSTAFGVQIDFAKKYDDDKILEILQDFNVKIKGKSVFIVD